MNKEEILNQVKNIRDLANTIIKHLESSEPSQYSEESFDVDDGGNC